MAPPRSRGTADRPPSAADAGPLRRPAGLDAQAVIHDRLRDLTVAFSRDASSSLALQGALGRFAAEANVLLGAQRTSVWLHERRARELALAAASDDFLSGDVRVSTDEADAPAVRGLRLEYPEVAGTVSHPVVLAPLRGWRRALGTLVLEGPFTEGPASGHATAALAHELGRQLSAALENIQLLEEVLRQRRLLEDTFNSILDLVIVTDSHMRIVQVNEAFVTRVGRPREEVHEQLLDQFVSSELAAWVGATDAPGTKQDGARTQLFADARLSGIFSVTATPLIRQAHEPAGHVLVARDITQQTRLEEEREALRERLSQSQKLAALGQFVAGVAHEMNNPLQGVLGHLELLIEMSDAAKPLKRDLRRIYTEADRAAKIVRNLLAFTGSHRMVRRRLKLPRVLSRVIASRQAALERGGITVVHDIPDTLPIVPGDPLLLHQAFLNVIINAEHAIAASGRGGRIEIDARRDGPRVRTTIRDTGEGIPADVLPRIFDPFFTTKDVGKGTGLGLALTYGIVQDHHGAIYAANAPGGGAIFTIELPAAPDRG